MTTTKKSVLKNVKLKSKRQAGPHLIVKALAGTGKTTTIVEGLNVLRGIGSSLTPSAQQQAVWDEISKSGKNDSVCFVAFNKAIAVELQKRVPADCEAMTMHSMGFAAVRNAVGKVAMDPWRVPNMVSEILGKDLREIRKRHTTALRATERLVSLCKMNLVGTFEEASDSDLLHLAHRYDIDLNDSQSKIFDLVIQILDRCKKVSEDRKLNYDDMVWLPIALGLSIPKYDLLLVDEAQDLNRCQQALALKAGKRIVLVGDVNQAIYGFAGADSDSIPRMEKTLKGCVILPLTETRRCGRTIVEEARQFVPDFEAHESNSEGSVKTVTIDDYQSLAQSGDMILCRVNAPLVKECFGFIRAGRKATIKGRDIGQGLVSTVQKMKASTIVELVERLSLWIDGEVDKETSKKNPNENRIEALNDRHECLCYFIEDSKSVADVIAKIEKMFQDKQDTGIVLSSIHKAKGLEASRVFFLQMKNCPCPHPMAKTPSAKEQEYNLVYVAITRAINELVYVTDSLES